MPEDPHFTNIPPGAELVVSGFQRDRDENRKWRPENLVDRDTTVDVAEWNGRRQGSNGVWFALTWGKRIEAQEVTLYSRDLDIESATLSLLPAGAPSVRTLADVAESRLAYVTVDGPLKETGTRIQLPTSVKHFQTLHVEIRSPGLKVFVSVAEIEVVGRSVEDPILAFRRGDADCNKFLDITDALAISGALFLGRDFCCEAAADLDADGTIDLSDPLSVLNYLFLNGAQPPEPFSEGCGEGRTPLDCEEQVCLPDG